MFNPINFISKFIKSNNQRELDKMNKIVQKINLFEKDTKIQSAVIAVTNDVEDKDWYDICNLANLSLVSPENFLDYFKDLI